MLAIGGQPLAADFVASAGAHHGLDRQVILVGELEVALVVGRHGHYGAIAVVHQHIVGDPYRQLLAGQRVLDQQEVAMPFFSWVAMSASATLPLLHSSMNACSAGLPWAAWVASGCSAATAT